MTWSYSFCASVSESREEISSNSSFAHRRFIQISYGLSFHVLEPSSEKEWCRNYERLVKYIDERELGTTAWEKGQANRASSVSKSKAGICELSFSLCTIRTGIGTKSGLRPMTAGRLLSYTCNRETGVLRRQEMYYRIAIQVHAAPPWKWQSTARREERESGLGGDHDLPYRFSLPLSLPQVLAWMTLLAKVQRSELHPRSGFQAKVSCRGWPNILIKGAGKLKTTR
jgi:hypothetical protein